MILAWINLLNPFRQKDLLSDYVPHRWLLMYDLKEFLNKAILYLFTAQKIYEP